MFGSRTLVLGAAGCGSVAPPGEVTSYAGDVENVRLEHRHLRGALEFALSRAEVDRRSRPPVTPPAGLRPFLGAARVPTGKLGALRRVVEADVAFRERLAVALDEGLAAGSPEAAAVGPIGRLWLQRPEGWIEQLAGLVEQTERAEREREREAEHEAALARERRRRVAAEEHLARERGRATVAAERADRAVAELAEARAELDGVIAERDELRAQLSEIRTELRHANDRAAGAIAKVARLQSDRDHASERAERAEGTRDAVLADRADRSIELARLADAAAIARRLALQLAELAAPELDGTVARGGRSAVRTPVRLPGGVVGDSEAAAEHLLRSGAAVLVDGYNVAMLGWSSLTIAEQRRAVVELAENLARRFGTDITIVFDGAEVVGAATDGRRVVRVVYSPPDVIADDVIRAEVARLPSDRQVVVVTNDAEIVRDVRAAGANPLASDWFLMIGRR